MHSVKVKRQELLDVVRKNRDAHREIFEKALAGYRRQAITELDAMLADAKSGRQIRRAVNLIEPMDQTRDYDRAIRQLEMSVDDVIELDEQQFAQYVCDDWRWKGQFATSTESYL